MLNRMVDVRDDGRWLRTMILLLVALASVTSFVLGAEYATFTDRSTMLRHDRIGDRPSGILSGDGTASSPLSISRLCTNGCITVPRLPEDARLPANGEDRYAIDANGTLLHFVAHDGRFILIKPDSPVAAPEQSGSVTTTGSSVNLSATSGTLTIGP